MSDLAPPASSAPVSEPVGFGPAVVSVFVSRAIGGAIVSLFWSVFPLYGHSYSYNSWNRYVIGYSLAGCVIGAFFLLMVLKMFRYELSYLSALVALFAGVIVANFVFSFLASTSGASPYWTLPFSTAFGPIGSLVSLLVSSWIVVQSSSARHRS